MKNICHNFYRTIIFNASALGCTDILPEVLPESGSRVSSNIGS